MALEHCRNQLMGAARDAYPYEACGIITHDGMVWSLRNISASENQFAIHPSDLVVAWEHAAAIWHSHPTGDPTPSDRDLHGHPETNAHGKPLGMVIVTARSIYVVKSW